MEDFSPGKRNDYPESNNVTQSTGGNQNYLPPWTEPYIIGIGGNSGSGKTSISQKVIHHINQPWTVLVSFDNFYKPLNASDSEKAFRNEYDFDRPESLDFDQLYDVIRSLKSGKRSDIPIYSFTEHRRTNKTTTVYGANVIIIEGIYALYDKRLLNLMDLKIFVDTGLDVCLSRRLTRDILFRGRDLAGAIKQWETFVKPNAVRYVNPTVSIADIVIPGGLSNERAMNLMIAHLQKHLAKKSYLHLQRLLDLHIESGLDVESHKNIRILPPKNRIRGLNAELFSKTTTRSDFIYYFDRIAVIIIEYALESLMNYHQKNVITPEGYSYQGIEANDDIVAVNIIRSGDCFMNALKKTIPEISVGKFLIQSDSLTGEPQLHTESLPRKLLDSKKILLFDAQIISGSAAIMAIQVLIDHKVKMENILLCCYLSTEIGLRRILRVFPQVRIVIGKLSSMDNKVKQYNIENFKDTYWQFRTRFVDSFYFGT